MISLARAFKYSGCQNIVMSLWKVDDLSTRELMTSCNRNLKNGMNASDALRSAKISYLENNRKLHPYYWASFVYIGGNIPIYETFWQRNKNTALTVFLILILLMIYYQKKVKSLIIK